MADTYKYSTFERLPDEPKYPVKNNVTWLNLITFSSVSFILGIQFGYVICSKSNDYNWKSVFGKE
jgi:hypothetical protein